MTATDGTGQGFTQGFTEGFTGPGSRGSRVERPFQADKAVLGIGGQEWAIGRRMRAQGFTKGLSCTPREPLVNPSNTPGEPLKPLKSKYDPFMRPFALSRRHNPSFRSQGFTGFTGQAVGDLMAVLTGVAMVALLWWWTVTAMEPGGVLGATVQLALAATCMASVALSRRALAEDRRRRHRWRDLRRVANGLCSEVSASRGGPSAEPSALDSEASTVGSRL